MLETMNGSSNVSTTNIVAAAMSSADLVTSANLSKFSTKSESTSPTSSIFPVPANSCQTSSQDTPIKTERMETRDHLSTSCTSTKLESPACDTLVPSHMVNRIHSVTPSVNTSHSGEVATKEYDPRNISKANGAHLVNTSSAPENFSYSAVNGDKKPMHSGSGSSEDNFNNVAMDVNTTSPLTKIGSGSADIIRSKPCLDTHYPITCGPNKGELVWKKFICPGINAKCVKCGNNWLTPKEFVNLAGKSTLKDWKRAIRINGTMLRRLIENGELNYYEHETNCSNQCRSNKNNASFDSDMKPCSSLDSDMRDPSREVSFDNPLARSSSDDFPQYSKKTSSLSSLYMKSHENSSSLNRNSIERSSSEDSGLAASPHLESMLMRDAPITIEKLQDLDRFWNAIAKLDYFDEIISDIVTQIKMMQTRTKQTSSLSFEDSIVLTNIVNCLEMFPSIVHRVSVHKHKVERETEESTHVIQELEKKLAEHKKYEQDLKRKSLQLDNVMLLTPNEKRQKIIRIGRQKAVVESRIPPSAASGTPGQVITQDIRDNGILESTRAGINQTRDMWTPAMQAAVANAQMAAHMSVAGATAHAPMSTVLPPFSLFPTAMRTNPDVLKSNHLHQAFVSSPQGSRESAQSPKKQ